MKITRENYEIWFLDYLDGNLDPQMETSFHDFLTENPDLAAEIDLNLPALSPPQQIKFSHKSSLKKSVYDDQATFDHAAIALMEGDLSSEQKSAFEQWLTLHPDRRDEVNRFAATRMKADPAIHFPNKAPLKKKAVVLPLWTRVAAAAAVVALALLLFTPRHDQPLPSQTQTAQVEDPVKSEKPQPATTEPAPKPDIIPATITTPKTEVPEVGTPKPVKPAEEVIRQDEQQIEEALREPELLLAELPRKTIIFELVDELQVVRLDYRPDRHNNPEVQFSDLLKTELDNYRSSDDRELLSTDHLTLSGLQLVAKLSGKRLTARKDTAGELRSVAFNSKLLAFSIPVNR